MTNYIVCYPPGASGRFLSMVMYKIANNINDYILTTPENSGHLESENNIISGYNPVDNNNHPFVFRDLKRDMTVDVAHVFSTHAFPKFKIIERSAEFNETKFVLISDDNDYSIFVANHLIKSLFLNIKEVLTSPNGIEEFKNKIYYNYVTEVFLHFKNIYGYELTLDNFIKEDTIKNLFEMSYNNRSHTGSIEGSKFKYPINIPDHFKDRTLIIKYKDIFVKTKTSYVALEQLKNFIGGEIPPNVMNSYIKYVDAQQVILDKYFSWLTKSVDTQ